MSFTRPLRRTARQAVKFLLAPVALRHRRSLAGTRFVAITGSTGKTTTKSLLTAILSSRSEVICNPGTANVPFDVLRTVLSTRKHHAYCVQELAAWKPGSVDWSLRLFEPEVTVVTRIGIDHFSAFGSSDAIAAEKVKAVKVLPASGVAVLNADDPRVLAMREQTRAKVVLYGSNTEADLRLDSSAYSWPGPLSLRMTYRNETVEVQTRLHGHHWVGSVMAATAAALSLGATLARAAVSIASVEPENHRLSTIQSPAESSRRKTSALKSRP
jgi:UDP-N-acetylmuramoyl-tripeptide--D-alanyl-D-alanine ligase